MNGVCLTALVFMGLMGLNSSGVAESMPEEPYVHRGSRIVVAKVFPRDGLVIQEKYFKMIADAGFDVVIPVKGRDDENTLQRSLELCSKYGLKHMLVRRGTEPAGDSDEQFVWQNGVVQKMARPFSDRLWKQTIGPRVLAHARRSLNQPAVGAWFDFELYEANDQQNVQWHTFDDKTIAEFAAHAGRSIPDLPNDKRYPWFIDQGLLEQFYAYQLERYRRQVRWLRQQVDSINPRFQFGIYPGPVHPFLPVAFEELTSDAAPVIMTPADTYARVIPTLPDSICLDASAAWCRRAVKRSEAYDYPHLVFGGVMPGHVGADPAWTAKNAYTVARGVDGYWLYFQQVLEGTSIENYMTCLAAAHFALDHGDETWMDRIAPTIPDDLPVEPSVAGKTFDLGISGSFSSPFIENKYATQHITAYTPANLRRYRAVILQNFNISADQTSPLYKVLRDYVAEGGNLLLTHDTPYFFGSPFPDIVKEYLLQPPLWHHVDNAEMKLVADTSHPILAGLPPNEAFQSRFTDYLPLAPGPQGTVLVENDAGQAIYVVGRHGKGRVVFAGSYFWYRFAEEPYGWMEDHLLRRCVGWLLER
jgi:hypothetical protein